METSRCANRVASWLPIVLPGFSNGISASLPFVVGESEISLIVAILLSLLFSIALTSVCFITLWVLHRQKVAIRHQREIERLSALRVDELEKMARDLWLQSLSDPPWRSSSPEVEIEAKFVHPLLKYLGYNEDQMDMRVRVPVQAGRQKTAGEADWTVKDGGGHTLVVVEAKAPSQPLTEEVQRQAQSYAFGLHAPVYIVTNAQELRLFHRGILKDTQVVSCSVARLRENWDAVWQAAGKESVLALVGGSGARACEPTLSGQEWARLLAKRISGRCGVCREDTG